MSRPERASGWGKPVVSRETQGPSFRHSLHLSCLLVPLMIVAVGCGYAPARHGGDVGLSVRLGPTGQPELAAVQAVVAGARSELATLGQLSNEPYPALVLELFHVQESSAGVRAPGAPDGQPLAGGSLLSLAGRGFIADSESSPPRADTGVVRVDVAFAAGPSPELDQQRYRGALNRAARQLGRTLARKALGLPAAGADVP